MTMIDRRVAWNFMLRVLETMNLPEEFTQLTNLLYTSSETRIKVNGHIGKPHATTNNIPINGVRQGCGLFH